MKRTRLVGALIGAVVALASIAHADDNVVTGVTFDVQNHDDVVVEILAAGALEAPRIRNQRGQTRIWFPHIDNNPRVTIPGDGQVLDSLVLRPGVADTAVLTIDLAQRIRLDAESVRFVPTERGGEIRIDRSALPPVIVTSVTPVERPAAAAPTEVAAPAAEAPSADGAPEEVAEQAADEAVEDAPVGTPLFADREPAEAAVAPMGAPSESNGMAGLMLISVLLGGLYMLIRFVNKRRKITIDDDITVVASKRLGPKYQLMVVRALGQDHLLSVHRGQTQLLSSMESPTHAEEAAYAESGRSILDRIQDRMGDDSVRLSSAVASEPIADEDRFGAKLLNLTSIRQRMQSTAPQQSEAVAGLMQLRARAK